MTHTVKYETRHVYFRKNLSINVDIRHFERWSLCTLTCQTMESYTCHHKMWGMVCVSIISSFQMMMKFCLLENRRKKKHNKPPDISQIPSKSPFTLSLSHYSKIWHSGLCLPLKVHEAALLQQVNSFNISSLTFRQNSSMCTLSCISFSLQMTFYGIYLSWDSYM